MNDKKMGQKIIDGRIVNLDDENIEKLESISTSLKKETIVLKERIEKIID